MLSPLREQWVIGLEVRSCGSSESWRWMRRFPGAAPAGACLHFYCVSAFPSRSGLSIGSPLPRLQFRTHGPHKKHLNEDDVTALHDLAG
jgi:hypothetical protein